jgi:hypothetical protein
MAALPLEIAQNNLTPCYYIVLHCSRHGDIREAVADQPVEPQHECPVCQAHCDYTFLARGGTVKPLPFWTHFGGHDKRDLWIRGVRLSCR